MEKFHSASRPSLVSGFDVPSPLKPTRYPGRIIRKPLCIVWAFPGIVLSSYTQLGFPCTRGIQLRFASSFSSMSSSFSPRPLPVRPPPPPSSSSPRRTVWFSPRCRSFCCLLNNRFDGTSSQEYILCRDRVRQEYVFLWCLRSLFFGTGGGSELVLSWVSGREMAVGVTALIISGLMELCEGMEIFGCFKKFLREMLFLENGNS